MYCKLRYSQRAETVRHHVISAIDIYRISMRQSLSNFLTCALVAISSGCVINSENTNIMPGVDLSQYKSFFVVEEEDDQRKVSDEISYQLASMGYESAVGEESEILDSAEILVRYETEWHWDITTYLFALNIRFQDAASLLPLASGTSTHGSTNRKSTKDMAAEVLTNIFTGNLDTSQNDFYDITIEQMLLIPQRQEVKALPISAEIIGFGTQNASDDAFNEAINTSIQEHGLFESISGEGEYTLTIVLHSLMVERTNIIVFGTVFFHNVNARASWTLTEKANGSILYSSEIVTKCPEGELVGNLTKLTACAIRENIGAGIDKLSELKLD